MYHLIVIVGYLGRDPEMRYTESGSAVCNFSVACTRVWNASDGKPQKETTWFKVTTWGNLAENCNQFLKKRSLVLVEGRLIPDKETGGPRIWTSKKNSMPAATFEVTAATVRFLTGKNDPGPNGKAEGEFGIMETEPDQIPF